MISDRVESTRTLSEGFSSIFRLCADLHIVYTYLRIPLRWSATRVSSKTIMRESDYYTFSLEFSNFSSAHLIVVIVFKVNDYYIRFIVGEVNVIRTKTILNHHWCISSATPQPPWVDCESATGMGRTMVFSEQTGQSWKNRRVRFQNMEAGVSRKCECYTCSNA